MRIRRLSPALSVCLAASVSTAVAQPKKGAPAPTPAASPSPTTPPAPGTGPGTPGQDVQPTEDAPPSDMEGRDENPDAPKVGDDEPGPAISKPAAPVLTGYPIEETLRPITLPKGMSEVVIAPHLQVSDVQAASALRARYGITDKIQLGLTYMLAGIFDNALAPGTKYEFNAGKAVGLDVTVLFEKWVGVRLGVPFYIDPLAVAIDLGAPMKWQFSDGKYAIGALDDLLSIKVKRFAPSFYQEASNAAAAAGTDSMSGNNTIQSRGAIRFSGYGIMQYQPKMALLGRIGVSVEDFSTTRSNAGDLSGLRTYIRAGLQYSPRKDLDVGFSLGFDNLAEAGTFGPAGMLAFRL
jgi:hypothetical protein